MNNTLNLVIDFQNLAIRAMFTCGYNEPKISSFDTEEECAIFARKLTTDIAYIIRMFLPQRVIIAVDGKSPWRKSLYSEEETDYKGTRVKDNTKNWDNIFKTLDDLKNIYKSKGLVICEILHAEADDIAGMWKNKLFNKSKENLVLISSDKDWHQLIDYNPNTKNFCIVFNPIINNKGKRVFYCSQKCYKWLFTDKQSNDIFFTDYSSTRELIKSITKDPKIDIAVVDPNKVLLEKVMSGDDGDNVPAFYHYYKNGKKWRITPLKASKILEELNINNINELQMVTETKDALKSTIEKHLNKELDDIDLCQRLNRQRRLVELNPILFPQEIQDTFKYISEDILKQDFINTNNISMQKLLQDTKYLDKNYNKPRTSDIFDNLKDLEKYITNPTTTSLF